MEDLANLSLAPFNPEPHDSCATRWDRWLKRFNNFVVAKDITDDKRKQAMLLHYGGEEVFEIHEALSVEGHEMDDFAKLTTKLSTLLRSGIPSMKFICSVRLFSNKVKR